VASVVSGGAYNIGHSYQNNGGSVNITGSPDWNGRPIVDLTRVGSGCSDNQYAQFDVSAVRGPGYGSVGMESGRNYMRGCTRSNVDMSIVRRIRVSSSERYRLELRADLFNAFNIVNITGRSTSATYNNPTSMTVTNNQFNTDGSLNQSRLKPKDAGFGAANGASTMRSIQLQLRFQF
jgi:hypothetical protein